MATAESDIVIVTGSDAAEYLQTQLTQDVVKLGTGESAWSFLLTPKSEIIALMSVTRTDEVEYTLEMDAGWGDTVRTVMDEFLGRMDISFSQGTVVVDAEEESNRIARGWPKMGKEIDGDVTPAMTGLVSDTIDFDKGCYTGQEFVARVHYRDAAPPRRLVRLTYDDSADVHEGEIIVVDDDEVGVVTSVARGIGLGYLKRAVDVPLSATVGDTKLLLLPIRPS